VRRVRPDLALVDYPALEVDTEALKKVSGRYAEAYDMRKVPRRQGLFYTEEEALLRG